MQNNQSESIRCPVCMQLEELCHLSECCYLKATYLHPEPLRLSSTNNPYVCSENLSINKNRPPPSLEFFLDKKPVLKINYDGSLEIGEGMTNQEAVEGFLTCLRQSLAGWISSLKNEAIEEYKQSLGTAP